MSYEQDVRVGPWSRHFCKLFLGSKAYGEAGEERVAEWLVHFLNGNPCLPPHEYELAICSSATDPGILALGYEVHDAECEVILRNVPTEFRADCLASHLNRLFDLRLESWASPGTFAEPLEWVEDG